MSHLKYRCDERAHHEDSLGSAPWVCDVWSSLAAFPIARCQAAKEEHAEERARQIVEALNATLPDHNGMREKVEATLLTRLTKVHGCDLKRRNSKRVLVETEFICGAMTAINALFPGEAGSLSSVVPPIWPICCMSGRSVLEVKLENPAKK